MSENMYNDQILQWVEKKDYSGALDHPDMQSTQSNPLCGDRVTIQLKMEGNTIRKMSYQVRGCILCQAACAHMASLAQGSNGSRIKKLRDGFENFLKQPPDQTAEKTVYEVFSPVRPHKSRHRCVLLPYETILKAISHMDG